MSNCYKFKPLNIGRWIIWSLFALVLVVVPTIFTSQLSATMLAQMGIAIIFTLSYNMLLGQSGMLSFGHAVYSGLGAYISVHVLNMASKGQLWMPVSLLPLVGGLAGAFFGVLFGYVTTKALNTPRLVVGLLTAAVIPLGSSIPAWASLALATATLGVLVVGQRLARSGNTIQH